MYTMTLMSLTGINEKYITTYNLNQFCSSTIITHIAQFLYMLSNSNVHLIMLCYKNFYSPFSSLLLFSSHPHAHTHKVCTFSIHDRLIHWLTFMYFFKKSRNAELYVHFGQVGWQANTIVIRIFPKEIGDIENAC